MSAATEISGLMLGAAALIGAYVAYRKYAPEIRKVSVETVDLNVKVSGESVRIASDLRDDAWEHWAKVRTEMNELRAEFEQYRKDTDQRLAEQAVEVRAARASEAEAKRQAKATHRENTQLRDRVQALETEVASLKASGSPDLH